MRGFTLVETLIVLALVAMLAGLGLALGMEGYRAGLFRADRAALVSALQHARAQAMNGACIGEECAAAKPHGVFIDESTGRYVIFQGESYAARDREADVSLRAAEEARGGAREIVFLPRTGEARGEGPEPWDIALADESGRASTTTVEATGRIRWTR